MEHSFTGKVLVLPGILFLVGLMLLSSGCGKTLRPSSAGITMESYPGITIKENSVYFKDRFQVLRYAAQKDDRGKLRVTITLRNLKGDTAFEYRYRWLDKDGIEIPSNLSIWQQMSSGGGAESLLTGIAPNSDVEDFILDIRLFHASTRW